MHFQVGAKNIKKTIVRLQHFHKSAKNEKKKKKKKKTMEVIVAKRIKFLKS